MPKATDAEIAKQARRVATLQREWADLREANLKACSLTTKAEEELQRLIADGPTPEGND